MLSDFSNIEIKVYIPYVNPVFLRIKNFNSQKIPIKMDKAVLYLLDENTGDFLGEIPVSWKGNEKRLRKLLLQHSKRERFFSVIHSINILITGHFGLCDEEITFFAKNMKLRVSRKNIEEEFGHDICIRDIDEQTQKKHSTK